MSNYNLPDGFEFIDIEEMTQGKLEKWQRVFNADFTSGQAVYNGAVVRASIKAGWFAECPWKVGDVSKQPIKGNLVPVVAKSVDEFYGEIQELMSPDPN